MGRILTIKEDLQFGIASAMAWFYFAVIFAAIGILTLVVRRFIYYENE
jgi:ABC-type sugar transport system permease subunit